MFRNRIPEVDKQYVEKLAKHISHLVIELYKSRQEDMTAKQAAVFSQLCLIIADRFVRLKPESESFVVIQNFLTTTDVQLINQRQAVSGVSACVAERVSELLSLIPDVKDSQVERIYAGRLLSTAYVSFLIDKYGFARSHVQDMVMGRTLPEKHIAQVHENLQLFRHTLQLPLTNVLHLLKKHGENLENMDIYFQSVQILADLYPELASADIQYFCLQTRDPQKHIKASYIKAQDIAQELNMSISRAFWYICHYHDTDKIREAYAKKTKAR